MAGEEPQKFLAPDEPGAVFPPPPSFLRHPPRLGDEGPACLDVSDFGCHLSSCHRTDPLRRLHAHRRGPGMCVCV